MRERPVRAQTREQKCRKTERRPERCKGYFGYARREWGSARGHHQANVDATRPRGGGNDANATLF
jgi:hypothetical protein